MAVRRSRLLCACVLVSGLTVAGLATQRIHHSTATARAAAAPSRAAENAPGDDFLTERLLSGAHGLADNAFTVAGQEALQVRAQTAATDPADANATWTFDGPTNVGGRVADLAVDPAHAGTVYAATAGGGVWKTTDAGRTFAPAWPATNPQSIGAIAVGPDGTVWAGTGETNPGGGSITFAGDGIYRSSDGGQTWTDVGLTDSWTIARIVVNPGNPQQVWVAVSGNLFLSGHQRGVYVTNNGGLSWTQSLAAPNGTTGASDLAIDPKNPTVVFAGMWDHVRVPDHRTYTGVGSGVWKTSDGGTTWTELTSAANAASSGLPADNPVNGRIGIAIDPQNDKNVYVNYANDPTGAFEAWFVSRDGGASFSAPPQAQAELRAPVTNSSYVYGWWFAKTFVDPKDSNHVFMTGLCLWSSTDAGSSFANDDCSVHSDQHAVAWDPNVANQVYLGDDGGFYTSTTNGVPSSWHHASYQPWSQFDGLDVGEQNPAKIAGGLQDNGSQRSWNSHGAPGGTAGYSSMYGGDGQQNLINPRNDQIVYACLQYGNCAVSTDGGNTMNEFDAEGGVTQPATAGRHAYFTPLAFDPTNPSTVYYAGDIVNVSNDDGSTWRQISPNLGGDNPGTEINPLYAGHYGAVTTISVSKSNHNVVWVGTDTGTVWYTTDALTTPTMPTWTQVTGLPGRWVSKVYVDPEDPRIVFVGFSGYRSGDNNAYVERSNDGGATWTDLSAGLPEATVNDATLAGGRLWVSTDTGVYASDLSQDPLAAKAITWRQVGANLPDIADTALRYVAENNTMYVSTFGRGVWQLSLGPPAQTPEAPMVWMVPLAGVLGIGVVAVRRRPRWTSR